MELIAGFNIELTLAASRVRMITGRLSRTGRVSSGEWQ